MSFRRLPLALTLSRVPLAGVGYAAAYLERPGFVVAAALTAVGTDILDGVLARRLGVASPRGANLDSIVDFVFYVSVTIWTVWLTPELLRAGLGPVVGAFAGAYVLLFLGGLVLARNVAVHNKLSRMAATVATTVALFFVAFAYVWWLLLPVGVALLADVVQRAAVLGRHLRHSGRA